MPRNSHRTTGNHTEPLFPELALAPPGVRDASVQGPSVRQEVLNVLVARLLKERGIIAAPEQILRDPFGSRRMPDVLVDFQGLRLVIEGEFASNSAKQKASKSALKRVEDGIAHIGMALIYPSSLRQYAPDITRLEKALAEEPLEFAVITESETLQSQLALPELLEKEKVLVQFARGNLSALADALRSAYQLLLQDRVLERAIEVLNNGIGEFLYSLKPQAATTARFAAALEMRELPKTKATTGDEDEE